MLEGIPNNNSNLMFKFQ